MQVGRIFAGILTVLSKHLTPRQNCSSLFDENSIKMHSKWPNFFSRSAFTICSSKWDYFHQNFRHIFWQTKNPSKLLIIELDLVNRSFRSSISRVLVWFGTLLGQSCLDWVRMKFRFGSLFGSTMFGLGTGSVRVKLGSGLFPVVYSNPIWIRYGSSLIQGRWNSAQYLGVGLGVNQVALISNNCIVSI